MWNRIGWVAALTCAAVGAQPNPAVRFELVIGTFTGDIDVELLPQSAPRTVENFLNYVRKGAYNGTFIHRSVPGFVVQGGGYTFRNNNFAEIPQDPPVVNEFRISNTRGTIAMAKLGSGPNTATNQWFFNLSSTNASNLDNQNGGFTAFGRIIGSTGLSNMDRIAAVRTFALQQPFDQIPLVNFTSGQTTTEANLVLIKSVREIELPAAPQISENGIVTAANFGGFAEAAPGTFIEIFGQGLSGGEPRSWATSDFNGNNAPTRLNNTTVTVGGVPAYISYVSPTQINAQISGSVQTSGSAPVVVTFDGRASQPVPLRMKPLNGGLLAPPSFKVGDVQYVAAQHAATGKWVSNGRIPDTENLPAERGETLIFYGIGFGQVSPGNVPIAGQIARQPTALFNNIEFKIGGVTVKPAYAGFIQGLVGLYQFNVEVPQSTPAGDQPLEVILGNEPIAQTLLLSMKP
ncbi:MAG: hypothetical protein FJW30_02565 [Acidobacteria bacterium]|nr:hypothetical protein [Acidobacteriota bacterium]